MVKINIDTTISWNSIEQLRYGNFGMLCTCICVCVWCGVCVSIKCIQCDWSSFGCIHRSTLISSSLFERRTPERIQWIPENNTPAINTNILSLYISYMRTFFFSLFKAFFKILNRGTVYTNKQFWIQFFVLFLLSSHIGYGWAHSHSFAE